MTHSKLLDLESAVKEIIRDFDGIFVWKKDDWVKSILAEFAAADAGAIDGKLTRHLPHRWDSVSVVDAPDNIQLIKDKFGGIKKGQFILASKPEEECFIVGAWWPWGNGVDISIRLAPFSVKFSQEELEEFIRIFQSWFNPQ